MKIYSSPYTLTGKFKRHGTLLRVEYTDGSIGYADLHPWPELGDEPLREQWIKLKKGQLTALSSRSLYFAKIDAEARTKKIRLLDGKTVPPSHYLATIGEKIPDEGWTTVKIKIKRDEVDALVAYLPKVKQKVRLDCNCSLDLELLQKLEPFREQIEFIEDPAPYTHASWKSFMDKYSLNFAVDRLRKDILDAFPHCVNIYKPAVETYTPHPKTVVTSYLDHPFGQVCAAYEASLLPQQLVAGLLSHRVYEPNNFSEQLNNHGPSFKAPDGYGFGFDETLESLDWTE